MTKRMAGGVFFDTGRRYSLLNRPLNAGWMSVMTAALFVKQNVGVF